MIETRAQELVVGCLAASAAVAAASSLAAGKPPGMRMIIGFGFVSIGLATASMAAPDLAGGLAVLILTTTLFTAGAPLMEHVAAFTGGSSSPSTHSAAATVAPHQTGAVAA